jgi:peptidoglycan hydrolase CwlO-like protein
MGIQQLCDIQVVVSRFIVVFSGVRSELKQLKSSETGIQAKVEEAHEQLQAKDSVIEKLNQELEALKAKLAELERYISLHHTSVQSLLYALAWLSTCACYATWAGTQQLCDIQVVVSRFIVVFSGVRSELKQLKASETGIQAKVEEAHEQLQAKDEAFEALKAKLAELERYISLHHTSI